MPYTIRKIKNKNLLPRREPLVSVKNPITGKIYSYGTTKKKAERQLRLLINFDKN